MSYLTVFNRYYLALIFEEFAGNVFLNKPALYHAEKLAVLDNRQIVKMRTGHIPLNV